MEIVSTTVSDPQVLLLFSEYDDFMMDFLGDDKLDYIRYSDNENIENVWTATDGNISIGCVAFRKKAEEAGEIKRLFIRQAYRGHGIAKRLLKTVENHAISQGCHTLFLDTRITLEPAVSLYRNAGFTITFQEGLYIQMEKGLPCG